MAHADLASQDNPTTGAVPPDADVTPSENLFGKGQLALRIPVQLNAVANGPSLVTFDCLLMLFFSSSSP